MAESWRSVTVPHFPLDHIGSCHIMSLVVDKGKAHTFKMVHIVAVRGAAPIKYRLRHDSGSWGRRGWSRPSLQPGIPSWSGEQEMEDERAKEGYLTLTFSCGLRRLHFITFYLLPVPTHPNQHTTSRQADFVVHFSLLELLILCPRKLGCIHVVSEVNSVLSGAHDSTLSVHARLNQVGILPYNTLSRNSFAMFTFNLKSLSVSS
jgi:hypothetical protein